MMENGIGGFGDMEIKYLQTILRVYLFLCLQHH